jgi:hypothetical protein
MSKVQLQGNVSGTGVFTIASPNSNTDRTLTLPNETGTILTSGGAIAGTTGTFSGIIQANGGGIRFPATEVPSANANTLDDYEEGTFTPSWRGSGTPGTPSGTFQGFYTKIGNSLNIRIRLIACNLTGATGLLELTGLPFSMQGNGSVYLEGVSPAYAYSIVSGAGLMARGYNPTTLAFSPSITSAWDNYLMANSTFTAGGGSTYAYIGVFGLVD